MHERATLIAREDGLVYGCSMFLFAKNHAGTRTAKGFVGGAGHDLGVWHGGRMNTAGNQSGEVRHVHQVEGAHSIGNLAHAPEVNNARVSASATNDELGTFFLRQIF